ncbi:hypothetical protein DEU56DRAFT_753078 [Suillus clintonianus]|uniref:uncharacterized protein n=1 Tax=Suillus clintonianus TaxID=1904413 RepID=UPI001B87C88C|nr:uncharacterized protein DEU56DRAFT_753078 [Suillus clintonianus]KAG2148839.1 hypothetical protein DEU56DRAFT_753078 [Suillus clintonianus]
MATSFSPLANDTSISATADVDEEIAALAGSMGVCHSHTNAPPSNSRLPSEILAMVFEHHEYQERFDGSANDGVPACLEITHVCRYWREVALGCPALWTFICSPSASWLGTMLERSMNAPLIVMLESPVPLEKYLEPILSHLSRIKILQIPSLESDFEPIIRLLSSQPAPLLEMFEFTKPWVKGDPKIRLISNAIFQGHAPRLRIVHISGLDLSWTTHIFSGLRTLYVKAIGKTSNITISQLLSTLRRMPALEHLTLEWLRIFPEDEETELLDKVPLNCLKSITIRHPSIRIAAFFFRKLAIPVDAKIALRVFCFEGLHDLSDLFSAMNMPPGGFGSVFQSMRAIYISCRDLCVQFSTSMAMHPADSWNTRDDDIRLSIEFACEVPNALKPSVIFDLCRFVTPDPIQKLSLSGFKSADRDFWRDGYACLPDLEVIHVKNIAVGGLIGALEIIEGEQISDILFPALRVLELEAFDFAPESEDIDELDELDEYDETFRDLMEMRAKHGVPITALQLAECTSLGPDEVQGLREVVATVDWDEYEEPEDDSSDISHDEI